MDVHEVAGEGFPERLPDERDDGEASEKLHREAPSLLVGHADLFPRTPELVEDGNGAGPGCLRRVPRAPSGMLAARDIVSRLTLHTIDLGASPGRVARKCP